MNIMNIYNEIYIMKQLKQLRKYHTSYIALRGLTGDMLTAYSNALHNVRRLRQKTQ